jgi:hypothetical protein
LNRFSRISQNFSGFLKNKLHHVCLLGNVFQQTKNEKNRNFERDRLMLDISGPSLLKSWGESWILFQKQIEPYHVSLRRTQRHLAECNRKNTFIFIDYSRLIYDEMENNLVQINVIRCKSIIMQMNTSAQRVFMSLQRIFILVN